MDQEAQEQTLQDELDNWKMRRNQAALNDDDREFDELNALVTKTQKDLDALRVKLLKTNTDYEVEKHAKEARDLQQ